MAKLLRNKPSPSVPNKTKNLFPLPIPPNLNQKPTQKNSPTTNKYQYTQLNTQYKIQIMDKIKKKNKKNNNNIDKQKKNL